MHTLENMHSLGDGPGSQNLHFTSQNAHFATILGMRQNACRIFKVGEMHARNACQKCISIPLCTKNAYLAYQLPFGTLKGNIGYLAESAFSHRDSWQLAARQRQVVVTSSSRVEVLEPCS